MKAAEVEEDDEEGSVVDEEEAVVTWLTGVACLSMGLPCDRRSRPRVWPLLVKTCFPPLYPLSHGCEEGWSLKDALSRHGRSPHP